MMNILFLSQNSPGFSTLRSDHIREFLHKSKKYTTHEVPLTEQNIYEEQLHANLYSLSTFCDAIITAGPFLPALVLPYLNSKTPIWMDWPSDPLADGLSKYAVQKNINWSDIQNATRKALSRADAFGVISHRSKDALIGQLMLLGRVDQNFYFEGIHVTPVVCKFPENIYLASDKDIQNKDTFEILICGSLNTWFNIEELCKGLESFLSLPNNRRTHIHFVGAQRFCDYSPEGWNILQHWKQKLASDVVTCHPWLEDEDFEHLLQQCDVGLWMDKVGVEPYLGSRTRALFYAWRGLDIIGGSSCELAEDLCRHDEMYVAQSANTLKDQLCHVRSNPIPFTKKRNRLYRLQREYGLTRTFDPLEKWLENPRQRKHFVELLSPQEQISQLQKELHNVYNSSTWKILSSIHKRILKRKQ